MGIVGKAEHRFPTIEDKYDDRFIEITENNKNELEKILNGKILFTPGHTADSISLKVEKIIFCGDAAMNGFPSVKRLIIWIENVYQFKQSWDVILNTDAEKIYPAHGMPFDKNDIRKYIHKIQNVRLRPL